jgi:hypothetical protein
MNRPAGMYAWIKAWLAYDEGQEIVQEERNSFLRNLFYGSIFVCVLFLTFK